MSEQERRVLRTVNAYKEGKPIYFDRMPEMPEVLKVVADIEVEENGNYRLNLYSGGIETSLTEHVDLMPVLTKDKRVIEVHPDDSQIENAWRTCVRVCQVSGFYGFTLEEVAEGRAIDLIEAANDGTLKCIIAPTFFRRRKHDS